jgi:hypothetical protein
VPLPIVFKLQPLPKDQLKGRRCGECSTGGRRARRRCAERGCCWAAAAVLRRTMPGPSHCCWMTYSFTWVVENAHAGLCLASLLPRLEQCALHAHTVSVSVVVAALGC